MNKKIIMLCKAENYNALFKRYNAGMVDNEGVMCLVDRFIVQDNMNKSEFNMACLIYCHRNHLNFNEYDFINLGKVE